MFTRHEYMCDKVSHRVYYSQFITEEMVEQVKNNIGIERIKNSTDQHLNDIPLKEWNVLSGHYFIGERMVGKPQVSHEFIELCNKANEGISSSTLTCVYKEIAKQIKENKL
jgi:hypothetical protein